MPIRGERLEDVIAAAAGKAVDHNALLTPRQVIPAALVEYLQQIYGQVGVVDAQELYFRVKYEKSDTARLAPWALIFRRFAAR